VKNHMLAVLKTLFLMVVLFAFVGCQAKKEKERTRADKGDETPASTGEESGAESGEESGAESGETPPPKPVEVVFDPRTPPPGYVNCHRNHCHKVGGGVASYNQVMQEMGATSIVGAPKPGPTPPAPADVANPPADAEVTATGLTSKILSPGKGSLKPGPTSVVTVHYTGWTTDGKSFDSSVARGKPASFPLNRVIPGWTEGLQLMTVGEERRFWIPSELAYKGRPGRPQGMLVFDVMLMKIK
jgi:hypothetical protein